MTEKEKASMENTYVQRKSISSQSIISYDFDSTDEEQDAILPTTPTSRVKEISEKEQLILEMEQAIDQNTTTINRL